MAAVDYTRPLTPSGNLRRRRTVDRVMRGAATFAAFLAVAILVAFIYASVQRGASVISFSFLTGNPSTSFGFHTPTGGIANAIIGTTLIIGVATVIALPLGVLIAIFLTEYATPRWASPVRLALDLLYGLPSIVIALFIYGLLVYGHTQSGLAASLRWR